MRKQLLGYVLDALESDEREQLEDELEKSPQLQRDLEVLSEGLDPLRCDDERHLPPTGLAQRTCSLVDSHRPTPSTHGQFGPPAGRWNLIDMAVAAGIFAAACLLFFPAVSHSRAMARRTGCENNLRDLSSALAKYSENHNGMFPVVGTDEKLGVAGVYAPTLVDARLIENAQSFICPASSLAERRETFHVPTFAELRSAAGEQLDTLHRTLGGSYGYSLGHISGGRYVGTKNLRRAMFAIMADMPGANDEGMISDNHGRCGQNVLYEDGHVVYLRVCTSEGCTDHIYLNANQRVAPGVDRDDSVIVSSATRPELGR